MEAVIGYANTSNVRRISGRREIVIEKERIRDRASANCSNRKVGRRTENFENGRLNSVLILRARVLKTMTGS